VFAVVAALQMLCAAASPPIAELIERLGSERHLERETALWTLIESEAITIAELEVIVRQAAGDGQRRWALNEALARKVRGWNHALESRCGFPFASDDQLTWRGRVDLAVRIADRCGTDALPALRIMSTNDPDIHVRERVQALAVVLELAVLEPNLEALREREASAEALAVLDDLAQRYPLAGDIDYRAATLLAELGQVMPALDRLEQALTHGFDDIVALEHDVRLSNLRAHPRFTGLIRRLHSGDYAKR
jgi:hypothetical protein